MRRCWFPLWLVLSLAPVSLGQARLDPVAVDSASLLPQGLSGRYAPAQADEPAHRTWHLRGLDQPDRTLMLGLTLALGGPDDRADLAIAYDNTSWIPIIKVSRRVGPQEIDVSPWIRPGRFRIRLSLTAKRPERCWFSDPSWHGSGVTSDSPQQPWLPNACWWQAALAAMGEPRTAMGLPPSAVAAMGGGRLETTPAADWQPTADGWRAVGLQLPRGEQVALVLDGQADGAGLRLGRSALLRHELPFAPVGLLLDAETRADPPTLVALTRDRPVLRAVATGPLMLRYATSELPADGGQCLASATVFNCRAGAVDGQLVASLHGADGRLHLARSGYRFPPGPSTAQLAIALDEPAGPVRVRFRVEADGAVSDSLDVSAEPTRPAPATGAARLDLLAAAALAFGAP